MKYEDKPIKSWFVTPDQKLVLSASTVFDTRYVEDGGKPIMELESDKFRYLIKIRKAVQK